MLDGWNSYSHFGLKSFPVFHPIRLWKFCKVTHMNSIPWMVEIYGMKIHPKFIHHIFSHLYWVFPIFLLKQLKFIRYQAHSGSSSMGGLFLRVRCYYKPCSWMEISKSRTRENHLFKLGSDRQPPECQYPWRNYVWSVKVQSYVSDFQASGFLACDYFYSIT